MIIGERYNKTRHFLKTCAILIIFLLVISWTNGFSQEKSTPGKTEIVKKGGIYRRPLGNDPATLDSTRITDIYGYTVIQQLYDGLIQYDSTLNIMPAIAQSWKGSRDGLTWTFYIRKGVRFHHGREVTADDFVYSFSRILDPKIKSGAAELFEKVKGAKEFREGRTKRVEGLIARDRYTLEITLSEPFSAFISILAMANAKVVPKELISESGDEFGVHPVGTGPFKFVKWEKNKEIILEANPHYYGGEPHLSSIEYKIFPGAPFEKMFEEFEARRLEDSPIPVKNRDEIIKSKKYQIFRRPIMGLRLLGINNNIKPFDDRRIRQALNYAIDQETIAKDIYSGIYVPANGVLPPGMAGYNPKLEGYSYKPEKAKELLRKAGYPGGKGLPIIHIWSSVRHQNVLREDEAIKKYLNDIGLRVEYHYLTDWPAFRKMLSEGLAPVFRLGWFADIPDPDNFLYALFYSGSPTNRANYKNTRVDSLLLKAREETDFMKRMEIYRDIEKRIVEDAPIIPLTFQTYERVFQLYVKNLEVSALGDPYIPMKKIWLEH